MKENKMKDKLNCKKCERIKKLMEENGYTVENGYTPENGYENVMLKCAECRQEYKAWLEINSEPLDGLPMVRDAVIALAEKGIVINMNDSLFDILQNLNGDDREMFKTALKYPKGIPNNLVS